MEYLSTLLLLLLLGASSSRSITSELSIIDASNATASLELFEQWKERHGNIYVHPIEKARRFQSFRENLAYIVESNGKWSTGHSVGLNVFADLSNEEFRSIYMSRVRQPGGKRMQGREESCESPYSLDWRKKGVVTGVKNQGSCGSCWAFSSTGSMEAINAITTGDLISLSEQELVDCDTTNEGCNGGYMDYAFEWVINNGGIDTESNYPYTGQDGTCDVKKENIKVVTIEGYQDVSPKESALLCAVVNQPVSVGIDGSSLDFQLYTGGIYDGDCSSNPDDINHAVLIVGYGSQGDTDYWIVKNSWGTDWGIQGYFYIKRNTELPYGACAINAMASYPTKELPSPTPFPSPALPPPPPPSPSPTICGDLSYCAAGETCCCIFEFGGFCFLYGCCAYENAVCCAGSVYCCPQNYPICDLEDGLCLQNNDPSFPLNKVDPMVRLAKKLKLAKHKLPWTKLEGEHDVNHALERRERLEAFL